MATNTGSLLLLSAALVSVASACKFIRIGNLTDGSEPEPYTALGISVTTPFG